MKNLTTFTFSIIVCTFLSNVSINAQNSVWAVTSTSGVPLGNGSILPCATYSGQSPNFVYEFNLSYIGERDDMPIDKGFHFNEVFVQVEILNAGQDMIYSKLFGPYDFTELFRVYISDNYNSHENGHSGHNMRLQLFSQNDYYTYTIHPCFEYFPW